MNLETIVFENNTLKIINQKELPGKFTYISLNSLTDVIHSIKDLMVRGAPAIGIVAAYGLFKHGDQLNRRQNFAYKNFEEAANQLKASRPTAVNLEWAIDRMVNTYQEFESESSDYILGKLKETAQKIHDEDKRSCELIGQIGAEIIKTKDNILTHCNAGILATGGMGTALAPIYSASLNGKQVHVYVDETRPVGQGARLTYWELQKNNIPATLLADNMSASLMQANKINLIIVGADRIAANGDVANKIGTYALAILANYHQIPFYVAAPTSTFDMNTSEGTEIPIENRNKDEVLNFWKIKDKDQYNVYNPAFDVTPNELIAGIITEKGVIWKPFKQNIKSTINL